jgi:hypothetical protein
MNAIVRTAPSSPARSGVLVQTFPMLSPGKITTIEYDAHRLHLRVAFDTSRVVLFYPVPAVITAMLRHDPEPESVLRSHVLGKFAWTEVGPDFGPELAVVL